MKKPEADSSAPHRVSTTDAAQVTWWLHPPVTLLPDGSAEPQSSKTCPQAAVLGGQVAEWGGQGHLLTFVLLEPPKHQTKAHPEIFSVSPLPHLPCLWAALAHGDASRE